MKKLQLDEIYNDDCINIIKKIPSNSIDLIVTSPPYAGKRGTKQVEMIPIKDYTKWFLPISLELLRILKPKGSFVLNIKETATDNERSTYVIQLILKMREQGWKWTEEYIWRKTTSFPGSWPNRFRDAWERCLHFTKNTKFKMNQEAVMVPIGDWTKTRFMKKNGTVKKTMKDLEKDDKIRRASKSKSGLERNVSNWLERDMVFPDNVLEFAPVVNNAKKHSAAFPDTLPEWFIKLFTNTGDVVLDPFIGSGTTAITAIKLNRHYIGIEKQRNFWNIAKKNIKLAKVVPQTKNSMKKDLKQPYYYYDQFKKNL